MKVNAHAPTSARRRTRLTGDAGSRTVRQRDRGVLPTVHNPKVNLCSGFVDTFLAPMVLKFLDLDYLGWLTNTTGKSLPDRL